MHAIPKHKKWNKTKLKLKTKLLQILLDKFRMRIPKFEAIIANAGFVNLIYLPNCKRKLKILFICTL